MIVFLDTNILIYTVENLPGFGPKATARLAALRSGRALFMVSDLTRMESLVGPIKRGDTALQSHYLKSFAASDVTTVSITAAVCDRAARIRAFHHLKAMDSLQLAAAVEHGANAFLTADARLGSFPDITVEVLR